MSKVNNVLIVEDHPLIVKAYKEAISIVFKNLELEVNLIICQDADKAFNNLEQIKGELDLIFLDINLPNTTKSQFTGGEDLGIYIRKHYAGKIIVSTGHNDNFRLHNILKNIDPDGFLIKNDLTGDELMMAINGVIEEPPYYSKTVLRLLRKGLQQDLNIDGVDRKILYELSLGTRMKDLPAVIPLSQAAIERRKRNLKILFDLENDSDKELIAVAKEKGFI